MSYHVNPMSMKNEPSSTEVFTPKLTCSVFIELKSTRSEPSVYCSKSEIISFYVYGRVKVSLPCIRGGEYFFRNYLNTDIKFWYCKSLITGELHRDNPTEKPFG